MDLQPPFCDSYSPLEIEETPDVERSLFVVRLDFNDSEVKPGPVAVAMVVTRPDGCTESPECQSVIINIFGDDIIIIVVQHVISMVLHNNS